MSFKHIFFALLLSPLICFSQRNLVVDGGADSVKVTGEYPPVEPFYGPNTILPSFSFTSVWRTIISPVGLAGGCCGALFNPHQLDHFPAYKLNGTAEPGYYFSPRSWPGGLVLAGNYFPYPKTDSLGNGIYNATRNYLYNKLRKPLQQGKIYYIEYYIKPDPRSWAFIYSMDLYISKTPPADYVTKNDLRYFPASPQIKNTEGRFISDTLNWTRICGTYKAAGGEQYITLGNFRLDEETKIIKNINAPIYYGPDVYYFIDDVVVTELTDLPTDTTVCYNSFPFEIKKKGDFGKYFNYSDSTLNITSPGTYNYTVSNEACSLQRSITVKADSTFSFAIPDDSICAKSFPYRIKAPLVKGAAYSWSTGSKTDSAKIAKPGTYEINIKNSCLSLTDTFALSTLPLPSFEMRDTSIVLCRYDTVASGVSLSPKLHNTASFAWNTGESTLVKSFSVPGNYYLEAQNNCGTGRLNVTAESCPPNYHYGIWIANVFTPNNDGINDTWDILYNNIVFNKIEVYNRWGNLVHKIDTIKPLWDGSNMEAGMYYYNIEYRTPVVNEIKKEKGWLELIR